MPSRPAYTGDKRKLVLGIDVGTTFSGISYCLLEPGKVPQILPITRFPPQPLVGGDSKVPSVVWYDKDGIARAVGAEAGEESVRERAAEEGWQKASWFKLHMRPKTISLAGPSSDLPPLPVGKSTTNIFADFLGYLLKCARTYIGEHYPSGDALWITLEDTMEFVLTHPNGWGGAQQADLRLAAVVAGLVPDTPSGRNRIRFVTEGEASLNFCIMNGLGTDPLNEGKGVIIVDAGGGTVDISAYCKVFEPQPSFKEIAETACLMDGSVFVTKNARTHLEVFLRNSKYIDDIAEIADCFDHSTKLKFRNPNEFSYIKFGTLRDKDAAFNIANGQLKLPGTVVAGFFQPSLESIVKAVAQQQQVSSVAVSSVFLVGGFAASEWLFTELKRRLGELGLDVSRPDSHVNKAVSDGAVSFFLDHFVSSRISKDGYGIEISTVYDSNDPQNVARLSNTTFDAAGERVVPDQFDTILPRGTNVSETEEFRHSFYRTRSSAAQLASNCIELVRYDGAGSGRQWMDTDRGKFALASGLRPLYGKNGQYYRVDFDVIFSFGMTELKAQIAWTENGIEKRMVASTLSDAAGNAIYSVSTSVSGDRTSFLDTQTKKTVAKISKKMLFADTVTFALEFESKGKTRSRMEEVKLSKWIHAKKDGEDGEVELRLGGGEYTIRRHSQYRLALFRKDAPNGDPIAHWRPPIPAAFDKSTPITLAIVPEMVQHEVQIIVGFTVEERKLRFEEQRGNVGNAYETVPRGPVLVGTGGMTG
uniref:Actin-like ATPase domain-containing protein n=1 Tax=Mycena chlorophos TaxID=658473 RepID=A0ABQ0LNX7_MYCCL|nr:predicted protein [Mycena chlorophos]